MRKALSIARRGVFGDKRAEGRVDELVEVDDAQSDGDGQHQDEDLLDAGVAPIDAELQAKVDPTQRSEDHQELHPRGHENADRIGIDLVVAVEVRVQHDEQHDDHHIPHRRGDGLDGETVVGLQDAHYQAA